MSVDVHDNFIIISHRCIHHRLCNQISSHAVWNHSIFPLYSMTILNQPHRLVSFRFGETTPRYGPSKNIVRKFESLRAANSFTTKCLPTRKPCRFTNIGTDMIVSSRRLRSTSMYRRFLYRLQGKEWCHT